MTPIAKEKYPWLIVVLLTASGFILRMYDLGSQSFWIDEAISSIAATAILDTGTAVFRSGVAYTRGILNTALIALSFTIFGVTESAARIPSVIFGTLTIPLVYLIGSRWGNSRIGIIAAVLVAFSVWEIAWSRQARMYQQLQFFYILSLYLFYEFTRNKSIKSLALLTLSVEGAILSHVFAYALIPVFVLYLVISTLQEREWSLGSLRGVNIKAAALFVLVCAGISGFAYHKGIISMVLQTEIDYYDTYIYFLKKDLGFFLFVAVPGGTVLMNRDWRKGLLLIAALIIPLYFIFYHVLLLGTRYLYFVIPILFILIGYFLDFVIEYSRSALRSADSQTRKDSRDSDETIVNVIVALMLLSAMFISPAFTVMPKERYDLGSNAPQPDFRTAYSYVADNMQPDDAIVSAWTPPTQFYLGKSDYWLAFNMVGKGMENSLVRGTMRERYTNATAITDVVTFKEVVGVYDRGWVIVDATGWYKLRPSIREYIAGNLTCYVAANNNDVVEVYGWQ
jgi:4-amino-4-deoxy-L-arabinose transferase-like glycosyltransferase